jgi:hypothetical protein
MNAKILKTYLLAAGLFAFGGLTAQAGQIYLGEGQGVITNSVWSNFGATIYSDNGTGFAYSGIYSPPAVNEYHYTSPSTIDGQKFRFQLTNVVGEGVSFALSPLGTPSPFSFTTFQIPASFGAYNALDISTSSGLEKAISWDNFSFATSPSLPVNGAFSPMTLSSQSGSFQPNYRYLTFANDDGTPGDLSSIGWSFGADVTLLASPGGWAYLNVYGVSGNYTSPSGSGSPAAVPETSTWVMGFLALGASVVLIRRQTRSA